MTERLTIDQLRRRVQRRNKYGAKRAVVDGHTFPSRREARRYRALRLLANTGAILDLMLQPAWDLHAPGPGGAKKKVSRYIADFRYVDADTGETVVEDAKGAKTRMYLMKKKWLLLEHGVVVKEV